MYEAVKLVLALVAIVTTMVQLLISISIEEFWPRTGTPKRATDKTLHINLKSGQWIKMSQHWG